MDIMSELGILDITLGLEGLNGVSLRGGEHGGGVLGPNPASLKGGFVILPASRITQLPHQVMQRQSHLIISFFNSQHTL